MKVGILRVRMIEPGIDPYSLNILKTFSGMAVFGELTVPQFDHKKD
jgi:hypothetical protein